jgi:hypothetical protein
VQKDLLGDGWQDTIQGAGRLFHLRCGSRRPSERSEPCNHAE